MNKKKNILKALLALTFFFIKVLEIEQLKIDPNLVMQKKSLSNWEVQWLQEMIEVESLWVDWLQ